MDFEQAPEPKEQVPEHMLQDLRLKVDRIKELDFFDGIPLAEAYNELMEVCEGAGGYESLADNTDPNDIMDALISYQEQMQKIMDEYANQEDTNELSDISGVDIPSAKKEAAGRLIDLCIDRMDQGEADEPGRLDIAA